MRPIVKTRMLIYPSKANLDGKILFGKIAHHAKMFVRGLYGNREFDFTFWSMTLKALSKTLRTKNLTTLHHDTKESKRSRLPTHTTTTAAATLIIRSPNRQDTTLMLTDQDLCLQYCWF